MYWNNYWGKGNVSNFSGQKVIKKQRLLDISYLCANNFHVFPKRTEIWTICIERYPLKCYI